MIKVLVADDHPIVRSGLKQCINDSMDIKVTGEANDGEDALTKASLGDYDVIVLDITMPGKNGLDVLKQLKKQNPRINVLILTMHSEEQYAVWALKAGAAGYLTKEVAPRELVQAIRKIASGGRYISPSVAEKLAFNLEPYEGKPLYQTLSDRECQIMSMIVMGKRLKDIANELNLSIKTVSSYRSRILQKLNLKSNAEMVRYAVDNEIIVQWQI